MEAVIEVITNRVNAFGVSESVVQSAGADQILVQLPGVSDTAQAERVLQGAAVLEFREQLANTESQFEIEQRVRAGLLFQQEELVQGGDATALAENKAALERSSEAIVALFSPAVLTGRNLKDGAALAGFGLADEQPVLLADGGGADGVLHGVVVDLDSAVFDINEQHGPHREGVIDGSAHGALGWVLS